MSGGGIYPNLFCAHPPFQIDGNFGFAAAISEMLLQSQNNDINYYLQYRNNGKEDGLKGLRQEEDTQLILAGKMEKCTILKSVH